MKTEAQPPSPVQPSQPSRSATMPWTHMLLALAVVAIWGSNFVVIRVALDHLPPLLFATLRFCLVLLPAVFFVKRPAVAWRWLALYGVAIGFGQFGLIYIAVGGKMAPGHISPGLASLVVQAQVFFTIGLALYFSGERIRSFQIAALLLAVAGIGVILAHSDGTTTPLGLLLTLGAAISWAIGNHAAKASGTTDMLAFVIWSALFSIPPLLVATLLMEGPTAIIAGLAQANALTWGAVLWQTVANTLFGYVAWGWLLARHPAATVSPVALLVPVFGMGASALLLGEGLPAWKLIAAALVIGGLAINTLWPMASRLPGYPWRRGAVD
jgi:O-acetylserine/cysteine efflux transporter